MKTSAFSMSTENSKTHFATTAPPTMNVPSPYSIVSFTFLCVCRKLNWSASQCWCSPTWHTSIENANSVETCHDLLCLEVCTQLFHLACSQFSMYEQTKYKSCLYRWGWNLPCFQALLVGAGNQAMALPAFCRLQFFTCVCGEPGNKTRTKYRSYFYKQVIPC